MLITSERKKGTMSEQATKLDVYDVELSNGMTTQLRLTPDDAKDRGLTDKHKTKKADKPAHVVVGELDDDYTDEKHAEAEKARTVANKAAKPDGNK